ncbi:hypothetical protein [Haloferax volcanii]|uniref:Uncharacterized protein n=1 Tax=Haloferax volcanii TaxID=2246 RepID=A0A558G7D3_HALVO|nr:hypothetical protein [Haloferax volcanii]TVT93675.1 hypothetical protein FQA18_16045 [Haloferax volcanii]
MAVQNRPEIVTKTYQLTDPVANDDADSLFIYAPEGKVWFVNSAKVDIESGSGDGNGSYRFIMWDSAHADIVNVEQADNQPMTYKWGEWGSNISQIPQDDYHMSQQIQSLMATDSEGIRVVFNNTNATADYTGTRTYRFVFKEVSY